VRSLCGSWDSCSHIWQLSSVYKSDTWCTHWDTSACANCVLWCDCYLWDCCYSPAYRLCRAAACLVTGTWRHNHCSYLYHSEWNSSSLSWLSTAWPHGTSWMTTNLLLSSVAINSGHKTTSRTHSCLSNRALAATGPWVWDTLLIHIRQSDLSLGQVCWMLKINFLSRRQCLVTDTVNVLTVNMIISDLYSMLLLVCCGKHCFGTAKIHCCYYWVYVMCKWLIHNVCR